VNVAVGTGVLVAVAVKVAVGRAVFVAVAVNVAVGRGVLVAVAVLVGVGRAVDVGVAVGHVPPAVHQLSVAGVKAEQSRVAPIANEAV
jgi:hypothetical protein